MCGASTWWGEAPCGGVVPARPTPPRLMALGDFLAQLLTELT
ncbi:hypothetical protein LILAB_08415 [Corallococcus macrosporus]|uniref:Uncharacterized protein n=1 Tax=Myxococcus fulvus (strain ATCC BAA-855 / HW-1) TaxID=483219 RepID=F8CFI4_MYXFH|nr:hypothetical protein LILAB_08415 [Corallococcus macrosporus]